MNRDKRFAAKLRKTIEAAQAASKRTFPDDRPAQHCFVIGWLEAEAGIRMPVDEE